MTLVVVVFRGVVVFDELVVVLVVELIEPETLVDEALGVYDVLFGSVYVLVEVRSEDEYEEVRGELVPEVLRGLAVLVDGPSARALRSFLIL